MIVKILIFVLLIFSNMAFADQVAPPSSNVAISDNQNYAYVYRMKNDSSALFFSRETYPDISKNEFNVQDYPRSGFYEIKSKKLLWEIDHGKYKVDNGDFSSVVLDDGEHLIVIGPWASSDLQTAFSFYSNGKLLKYYLIRDICDDPNFYDRSMSHFMWKSGYELDRKNKKIRFISCGKENEIDITTGAILKSEIKAAKGLDENVVNAFEQMYKAMDEAVKSDDKKKGLLLYKNFSDASKCLIFFQSAIDQKYLHLMSKIQSKSLSSEIAIRTIISTNENEIVKMEENGAKYTVEEVCKFKLLQNTNFKKINDVNVNNQKK